jgi:hypothetical protein
MTKNNSIKRRGNADTQERRIVKNMLFDTDFKMQFTRTQMALLCCLLQLSKTHDISINNLRDLECLCDCVREDERSIKVLATYIQLRSSYEDVRLRTIRILEGKNIPLSDMYVVLKMLGGVPK